MQAHTQTTHEHNRTSLQTKTNTYSDPCQQLGGALQPLPALASQAEIQSLSLSQFGINHTALCSMDCYGRGLISLPSSAPGAAAS